MVKKAGKRWKKQKNGKNAKNGKNRKRCKNPKNWLKSVQNHLVVDGNTEIYFGKAHEMYIWIAHETVHRLCNSEEFP